MTHAVDVDVDVAVVGGGPVGSALAVLLGQRGRRVAVLERWPAPYPLPRAVHLDHEVARVVQACGLGDELRATTEAAHVYEWRNGAGTTLLRFGREEASSSGWPESLMFHQPTLEALLHDRLGQLPSVVVHRGWEVADLHQHDDAVVLTAVDGRTLRATWVVGCDGANSTVRGCAGLPVRDLGFSYDWLIVDVVLDEPRAFDPLNVQICDPARPTTAVSGGPGRRRWEFMRLPGETVAELQDPARAWALLAPWDVTSAQATLERQVVYTFEARWAERWRAHRVLLAGDAAHLMPPFAGQGLGAGLRDAANLAWKLDLVLAGLPDALLDAYQDERLPGARQAIEFSLELGRVICVADPAEAAVRDAAMAAAVPEEPVAAPGLPGVAAGVVHPTAAGAGQAVPQGLVDGRPLDDVLGLGWWLLVTDPAAAGLDADTAAWFASIGGRVHVVPDPGPALAHWLADQGARAVLQRPDAVAYGTAPDGAWAQDLVADLRAHLDPLAHPPHHPGAAS